MNSDEKKFRSLDAAVRLLVPLVWVAGLVLVALITSEPVYKLGAGLTDWAQEKRVQRKIAAEDTSKPVTRRAVKP
jgi:hypothetical protein